MEWEQTPDAQDPTEPSSADTPDLTAPSSSESAEESQRAASSPSDQGGDFSEPSSDPTRETSSTESEISSDESTHSDEGLLAGTASEQQPGVGGIGDHPAPAVMRDPATGEVHQAGQPPAGTGAPETTPVGDSSDAEAAGHLLSPEAQAELGAEHEPEQAETDRPDIGTPE